MDVSERGGGIDPLLAKYFETFVSCLIIVFYELSSISIVLPLVQERMEIYFCIFVCKKVERCDRISNIVLSAPRS